MRSIPTSVTGALAHRPYYPSQLPPPRLIMRHVNSGRSYCHRSVLPSSLSFSQQQQQRPSMLPLPTRRSYYSHIPMNHQYHGAIRTFAVQPTMIKYMPIQTIDVRVSTFIYLWFISFSSIVADYFSSALPTLPFVSGSNNGG